MIRAVSLKCMLCVNEYLSMQRRGYSSWVGNFLWMKIEQQTSLQISSIDSAYAFLFASCTWDMSHETDSLMICWKQKKNERIFFRNGMMHFYRTSYGSKVERKNISVRTHLSGISPSSKNNRLVQLQRCLLLINMRHQSIMFLRTKWIFIPLLTDNAWWLPEIILKIHSAWIYLSSTFPLSFFQWNWWSRVLIRAIDSFLIR